MACPDWLPPFRSPKLIPALLLGLALGAGVASAQPKYAPPASGQKPASYPDVQAMVAAAEADIQAGVAAIGRQDNKAARKSLDNAQDALEKALKTNPASRAAAQDLGAAYFYQGVAGDKGALDRAAKFLQDVVDADAEALQANRYLAHTYARLGKTHEAIVHAGQTAMLSTDPALTREMNDLKQPLQQAFLNSWYEYGQYYQSPAAQLTTYNPQTNQVSLVLQVTPQFEQELAAKGLQNIAQSMQMSQDAEVKKYVQKLVDKLVAKTPGPPFTYTVDIVESPVINAMAFPGRILVNTGLIKFCESEAELVTVLSHEVGHIYAHHSARALVASYRKRSIAGTLLQTLKVDNTNLKDQLITLGVSMGLEILDKGYSRGEEKEADKYGTHIAFNAGYNPTFMTKFFLRLYQANPKQPFKLLSTHPPTPERIEYTTAYLEAFPLETEMQIDSQEFKDMKQRLH